MADPASDPPGRNPGDILIVVGAVLLVAAASIWSVQAGLAVAGVLCLAAGVAWRP